MNRILIAIVLAAAQVAVAARPNILFIMSDDHAAHAIGAYGGRLAPLNPTPNIDKLAGEGMLLENAFCNNSICTPSRATIMTGQYSYVNGVTGLNHPLKSGRHYLSKEMQAAGYQTAVIGKWHLKTLPENFDYYKVLPGQGSYYDPTFKVPGQEDLVKMEGHSSDCITDSAIEWLKQRVPNKPFFLKYHFKAPHGMFKPAKRYAQYLAGMEIPEPESLFKRGNHGSTATRGHNDELLPLIGSSVSNRHLKSNYTRWGGDKTGEKGLSAEQQTRNAYREYMHLYLRCVKGVDDNIGRMIAYLEAEGLYDNTVIIYTSDQGFYLGEHDYIDKRWGYEEAMRMPFIVRYPKTIKPGTRSDAIVGNVDFAPTMLDFAGVPTPAYMQGKSFRSILESGEEPDGWKQAAYYHYWFHMMHHFNPAHIAIRTKQFKLMMFYGARGSTEPDTPPAWELYNLRSDPKEMNNVYDNPEYAGVIADLKQQLKELRARAGDDNPEIEVNTIINDYWDYDADDRARAEQISHEAARRWQERLTAPKQKRQKGKSRKQQ